MSPTITISPESPVAHGSPVSGSQIRISVPGRGAPAGRGASLASSASRFRNTSRPRSIPLGHTCSPQWHAENARGARRPSHGATPRRRKKQLHAWKHAFGKRRIDQAQISERGGRNPYRHVRFRQIGEQRARVSRELMGNGMHATARRKRTDQLIFGKVERIRAAGRETPGRPRELQETCAPIA